MTDPNFFSDLTLFWLCHFLQLGLSQTHYNRTECNVVSDLAIRTYEGVELWLDSFLSSALDIAENLAKGPGRFAPAKFRTITHWIGSSVVSRADRCAPEREEKSLSSAENQKTFPWLCNQFPGHCVTPTVTVLHLQSLCYTYSHCVIPTVTVLYLQSLCYTYSHCVTPTVTVLHLQSLCYTYSHCVTPTVTVLHLQSLHVTYWPRNVVALVGFTLLVESLMCRLLCVKSFWNYSSVSLLINL